MRRAIRVMAISPASGLGSERLLFVMLATLAIVIALCGISFAQASAAAKKKQPTPCAATIAKCGCAITKKGVYTVSADLSAADGLTPDNDCIEVRASNVILNLGVHKLTGPGGANTDDGIDIMRGANNDSVLGDPITPSAITGWATGVYVAGNNELFSNLHADSNDAFGFELDGSSGDRMSDWQANDPEGTFGLWIRKGSRNFIAHGVASTNGDSGIFVGCADIATTTGEDCTGVGKSKENDLFDNSVDANTKYGIGLDSNVAGTLVNGNSGSGNGVHDLFDDSPSCGSNEWFDDVGTKSDACID